MNPMRCVRNLGAANVILFWCRARARISSQLEATLGVVISDSQQEQAKGMASSDNQLKPAVLAVTAYVDSARTCALCAW